MKKFHFIINECLDSLNAELNKAWDSLINEVKALGDIKNPSPVANVKSVTLDVNTITLNKMISIAQRYMVPNCDDVEVTKTDTEDGGCTIDIEYMANGQKMVPADNCFVKIKASYTDSSIKDFFAGNKVLILK